MFSPQVKIINAAKLKARGFAAVEAACLVHTRTCLRLKQQGDTPELARSLALLDQCVAVARQLKREAGPYSI